MFPEPTFLFAFDSTEDEDIKMVKNLPNLLGVLQGRTMPFDVNIPQQDRRPKERVKDAAAFVCVQIKNSSSGKQKKRQLKRRKKSFSLKVIILLVFITCSLPPVPVFLYFID